MKKIKWFMALFTLMCFVVRPADYGVVAEYYTGNKVYAIGVNADNADFIGISSDGKNSAVGQFKIVDPETLRIPPIKPTQLYNFPYQDPYVLYVQYGSQDESKDRFYVQGFKGALFQAGQSKAIFTADEVITNDAVAYLEDSESLNEASRIFLGHHAVNPPYNVTLNTLKGKKKAAYNLSGKISGYQNYATSIITNKHAGVVAACYTGHVALALWNIETAQSIAQVSDHNDNQVCFSDQMLLDPHTNTYLLSLADGIWRYNVQDNTFERVIKDIMCKIMCLVDNSTLMLGANGVVQWFDTSTFKMMGSVQLFDTNKNEKNVNTSDHKEKSIYTIKKISDKSVLVGAGNGLIYQLRKRYK